MNLDKIKKLYQKAKTDRSPHEKEMRNAYHYTFPAKNSLELNNNRTHDRTKLFDNTAPEAVLNLLTNVERMLYPQNTYWVETVIREEFQKQANKQIKELLHHNNRKLHQHFRDSNFYMAAGEAVLDCIVTGTGCLAIRQDDDKISYSAIPVGRVFFTCDALGDVKDVFIESCFTADQIAGMFPDFQNSEFNEIVKTDPSKEMTLIEVVTKGSVDDFDYYVFLPQIKSATDEWHLVTKNENQKFNPFTVFRWIKTANSPWGESNVRLALPHIKAMNEIAKDIMVHTEYNAYGIWVSQNMGMNPKSLAGRLKAGSIVNLEAPLDNVTPNGDMNVAYQLLADHRRQVKNLLLDDDLPTLTAEDNNSYMTAQEVLARTDKLYRRVGQPALRLQKEFLLPISIQTIKRLQMIGALDTVQDQEKVFSVKIQSAAERGLKISEAVNDMDVLQRALQTYRPEQVAIEVDMPKAIRSFLDNTGFSAALLRDPEESNAIRQQQAQQLEQQNQMVTAQQGSQILEGLSKVDTDKLIRN